MSKKTKNKASHQSKSLVRSASSWGGAFKMLSLLSRSEVGYTEHDVSPVVASFAALDLLSDGGKI